MERLKQFAGLSVVTGPDWPGVSYFCTTRDGGSSKAPWASLNMGLHVGDDPADVASNRQRVLPASRTVVWLNQVHGCDVHHVDRHHLRFDDHVNGPVGDDTVQADALVTASADYVLAIMTADCLPVVLGSADGAVIGVAHAGWRGLAAGILENTLVALRDKHPGPAPLWRAWVGPGIGPSCFEVGDDVRHAFVSVDSDTARFFESAHQGKWLANLAGLAAHRLGRCGVAHVDISPFCTYSRPDLFYSYRRDGVTGRMVTLAWREPGA